MNKIASITIGLSLLTITCFSQTSEGRSPDSLVVIEFKCIDDSLTINIPSGHYETRRSWYAEGSMFSIIYSDRSVITILCGYSADLVLNDKNKDLFARKIKTKNGRAIIYEFVKADRVDIFNRAFDLFEQK
jgi:hypothetical protein